MEILTDATTINSRSKPFYTIVQKGRHKRNKYFNLLVSYLAVVQKKDNSMTVITVSLSSTFLFNSSEEWNDFDPFVVLSDSYVIGTINEQKHCMYLWTDRRNSLAIEFFTGIFKFSLRNLGRKLWRSSQKNLLRSLGVKSNPNHRIRKTGSYRNWFIFFFSPNLEFLRKHIDQIHIFLCFKTVFS